MRDSHPKGIIMSENISSAAAATVATGRKAKGLDVGALVLIAVLLAAVPFSRSPWVA